MPEDESLYLNHYQHCGQEWEDVWPCMCNDDCPVCGAEIEPYNSEDFGAEVERLRAEVA